MTNHQDRLGTMAREVRRIHGPGGAKHPRWFTLAALVSALSLSPAAYAGHAHYDFSTDPIAAGILDIVGNGSWVQSGGNPGGYLLITPPQTSQKTTIYFNDFDNGLIVKSFVFTADLKIGDGTGSPADGFSINYVRTNDPALLSHDGNGWATGPNNEANLPEEGSQTGLGIGFDAWQSGDTAMSHGLPDGDVHYDTIGISVRVDGQLVFQKPMRTLNGSATDPNSLQTGPRLNGDGTNPALTWQPLKVELTDSGTINIWWKGTQILTNQPTTYTPSAGRLIFTGRTGGAYQLQAVDNIDITTYAPSGPAIAGVVGTPGFVDLLLQDQSGITVDTTKPISFTFDGAPGTITPVSHTNNVTTLHYVSPVPLLMASTHTYSLIFTDSNGQGNTNANRSFSVAGYPFTAVSPANYMIEGTDFNFGGGQFIDNVVLASTASANNYMDKVGTANIDEYDPAENTANHAYRAYDSASSTGEIVGTEPVGTTEAGLRSAPGQKYDPAKTGDAAIVPYDVGWVDVGEWYNYTRTFPAGKYKVYSRLANGTGGNFTAQIDQVLSSPAAANQTVSMLGTIPGIPTGGWQNYQFFPLVDAFGNEVVLPLSGKQTFRFTTIAGGLNVEYFSLVPVSTTSKLTPYLAMVSPTPGATRVNPATVIKADIANLETAVDTGTIKLQVNGGAVTPTQTPIGGGSAGVVLSYDAYADKAALYPLGSTNTVVLTFKDNAGTSVTNQWSFVVISASSVPYTMPTAFALPANSGQGPGWSVRVMQIDQSAGSVNTVAWSEAMLAGAFPIIASGTDAPLGLNYNSSATSYGFIPNDKDFITTFNLAGGNNFGLEAVAYLALTPGVYTFAVNSDDGFRMTTGAHAHDLVTMPGAVFDAGRGAGTPSTWSFLVQTNGLYPFRLNYFEGGGGYSLELFSTDDQGKNHLIGDTSDPLAIRAYRFSTALPNNAIQIAQKPPATLSVAAGSPLNLSVAATASGDNAGLLLYEWSLGGNHLAYGRVYNVQYASSADAGNYTCTITYLGYQQSQATATVNVTITPDVTPPVVKQVAGTATLDGITITFDAPVDAVSASALGNYSISPALSITAATPSSDGTKVTLTTAKQTPGTAYQLTISGVKDAAGNVIAANTKVSFTGDVLAAGLVLAEFFDGISGTAVSDLTSSAAYQANQPTRVYAFPSFTDPTWENGDNYGQRMTAFLTAPATGNYVFWIVSDDLSELWLSTDDSPANVKLIATEDHWSNQNEFTSSSGGSDLTAKRSDQYTGTQWPTAGTITLTAGKKYYMMALQKEGGGGDGVAVAWTQPGEDPSATRHVVPGSALAIYVSPDLAALTVLQQPANVTTPEYTAATFKVLAVGKSQYGPGGIVYQWQKNGAAIPGATGAKYSALVTTADSGSKFTCVLTVPGKTVTTAEATLTVTAATLAPASAANNALSNTVNVVFNKPVDAISAAVAGNYALSGLTVSAAAVSASDTSGRTVALTTSAQTKGSTYSLTINNVKDSAGATIAANTKINTTQANITFTGQQPVGNDWTASSYWSDGNSAVVSAAANPGIGYELLPGSRFRSVDSSPACTFPGAFLLVDGDSEYISNPPSSAPISEIRFKSADLGTVYFTNLVLNGGQLDNGNDVTVVLQGKVTVGKDSTIQVAASNRGYRIDSQLTGSGDITFYANNLGSYSTSTSVRNLNLNGAGNTYSGQWNVMVGPLLASTPGALGTNNIIVAQQGVLETLYDVNNPNGTLVLYGQMWLHQNDTFMTVAINGNVLAPGTYTWAQLAAAYPNNFPASWMPINGSLVNVGSGSITVTGQPAVITPTLTLTVSKSGSNLLISWPTTAGASLKQASSLTAPISWTAVTQTPVDSGGTTTVTVPIGTGNTFFQVR